MKRAQVFLADDHALVRDGLKRIINEHELFQVVGEAGDGLETITKIEENVPDILLLDVSMPTFTGLQVIERLKSYLSQMKVVILTLHNNESYIASFLKAGVHGYLLKTAPAKEVLLAMEAVYKGGYYLDPNISSFIINFYVGHTLSKQNNQWDGLTTRELEVLKLIGEGYKNQHIADLLNVSVKTIESHRCNIMDKLDMHDRIDLVKYAIRRGIIQV